MFNGYRDSFPEMKRPGREVSQLVLSLRMGGVVRLLSLYAFRAWTGTALPFIIIIISIIIPVIIGATRIVTKDLKKRSHTS